MKFVLGTDGSSGAQLAVELLCNRPIQESDVVEVLTFAPAAPLFGSELEAPDGTNADALVDIGQAIVDRAVATLQQTGYSAHGEVRLGDPADMIPQIARTSGADLIVLGARGVGRVRRMIVGSVAEEVARSATCAVLLVHHARGWSPALIPTDGSEPSQRAVARYLQLLGGAPAEALLLQVNAEGGGGVLDATTRMLDGSGVSARIESAEGDETATILDRASRQKAAIVVLGAKRHVFEDEPMLGSTANDVIKSSSSNILIGR